MKLDDSGVGAFRESLLLARDLDDIDHLVETYLFSGTPAIFESDAQAYTRFRRTVATGLGIGREDTVVVGSAKVGFSLDPNKFPTPFGPQSDVDVVVVSDEWFDSEWLNVLHFARYGRAELEPRVRSNLRKHREHGYIYGGWIWPEGITECLQIGRRWFHTFRSLPTATGLIGRRFAGRLYRTWDHARFYHRNGLLEIQRRLQGMEASSK